MYNVVKTSVEFRTVCDGYAVVDAVLNVFFNSAKSGETDLLSPFDHTELLKLTFIRYYS